MENHLIIGLGGTGGNIIKAFRKRVYEEFGTNKIPNDKVGDVCVSYMWVDSSERDMNETQSWRTLGKSVALDAGDKVWLVIRIILPPFSFTICKLFKRSTELPV